MKENIEEDFEMLDYIIMDIKANTKAPNVNTRNVAIRKFKAIEHILSDYKRVLKENEELLELKISVSANNRIIELEKENFRIKSEIEDKRKEYQETYKDVREELKELKKENEELNKYVVHLTDEQYRTVIDLAQNDINQQWIQKVKDKIEELKQQENIRTLDFCKTTQDIRNIIIQELQDLIEGRK